MSYIIQKDESSCGPIAILNYMINIKMDRPELHEIYNELHTSSITGTNLEHMIFYLSKIDFVRAIECIYSTNYNIPEKFIVLYAPRKNCSDAHYCFMFKDKNRYVATNFEDGNGTLTHKFFTTSQVRNILNKKCNDIINPIVIVLGE